MWLMGTIPLGVVRLRLQLPVFGKRCLSIIKGRMLGAHQCLVLLVVVTGVFVVYHVASNHYPANTAAHSRAATVTNGGYPVFPHFVGKLPHKPEWYIMECYDGTFPSSMEAMFTSAIPSWAETQNAECRQLYQIFTNLFEIHRRYSKPMKLPTPFLKMVKKWLGNNPTLVDSIHNQHLIHVFQPLTSEHVVYNPLRSHRPIPSQPIDIFKWVDQLSKDTAKDCDFCQYETQTAVDYFGRQESQDAVRVSNTFKMEAWHSMIVTRHNHHPINLTLQETASLFRDATAYMHDVNKKNPHYIYPCIFWDQLPSAGASQVHPHVHVLVAPDHYYGTFEAVRSAAARYLTDTGRNYFTDMLNVHAALGLVVELGDAKALAMLSGKGDLEVMFLSDFPSEDLFRLLHYTILAYHDSFRQACKSLAGAWPALGTSFESSRGRIPTIIRLVSRGDCLSPKADVSSLEIFEVVYRNHDPWQVAAAIRNAIKKYHKVDN